MSRAFFSMEGALYSITNSAGWFVRAAGVVEGGEVNWTVWCKLPPRFFILDYIVTEIFTALFLVIGRYFKINFRKTIVFNWAVLPDAIRSL